jgi:hypothetical protein
MNPDFRTFIKSYDILIVQESKTDELDVLESDSEEIKVKLFNKYLLKTITIPPDLVLTFLLCEIHIIIW